MAASSGGVDWSQLVKPLLASLYGSINKQDIPEIAKAIIKSKEEFLHHDEEYEPFYASFSVLAADYLANNAHQVTVGGLNQIVGASKVLIRYLIDHVGQPPITITSTSSLTTDTTSSLSPSAFTAKDEAEVTEDQEIISFANGDKEKERVIVVHDNYYLSAIKALCRGSGTLSRTENVSLASAMKSAKLPSNIKTHSSERDSGIKESRRTRTDPSAAILEQLICPLHDIGGSSAASRLRTSRPVTPPVGADKDVESGNEDSLDAGVDMRNIFGSRCVQALQSLGGGETLIDVCLKLPTIQKYTQRYKELLEGKGHGFASSLSEAQTVKLGLNQVVEELSTASRIISLPILEPLNANRLQKLATIAMASILASFTVATASAIIAVASQGSSSSKTPPLPRDDDLDVASPTITEKALDLFNVVLNAVRSSTRAGGHHIQNLHLMGAWLIMTGFHQFMTLLSAVPVSSSCDKREEKGRSPVKKDTALSIPRLNLIKVQQGFGVVCVALASQGITLLTGLLEDVKVEGWLSSTHPEPARLDPLGNYTAIERIARIFNAVPLNQVLYYLATVSYRKAGALKRTQRSMNEGDTYSISDSTTYYEDDFSEESLGEDDDDSVIIGSWFDESATPGVEPDAVAVDRRSSSSSTSNASSHPNSQSKTPRRHNSDVATLVPEKGEPHGFISLASHVFLLMNNCLVESECSFVQQYVSTGLTQPLMAAFASIIKDLDKEIAKSYSGSLTHYLGPVLGSLYDEFSFSIYRYTHNLVASGLLSEILQITLLSQLNVSPWNPDDDWPLLVLPRTLSVLAQILLLRQKKDKDELKCDIDTACVMIWQRLVQTLVGSISKTGPGDEDLEDLNVEHAQLLLFLFHSLQLMQKKNVLLNVASAIVNVAPVIKTPMRDTQIIHLSRLLLIFDYLMKNLYEAPQALIDQVQWNLFKRSTIPSSSNDSHKESPGHISGKLYHRWQNLEENYLKYSSNEDNIIRPCFYTLTPSEMNTQDAPKLDGLACSFILATPDSLKYSVLYETLIDLLSVSCQLDSNIRGSQEPQLTFMGRCGVQYAFSLAYRTILTMPPSIAALEAMEEMNVDMDSVTVLHSLLWAPRAAHKTFNGWIKDGLVRQSMTTQKADCLLESVDSLTCLAAHEFKIARHLIESLTSKLAGPPITSASFSELFLLDAVLSRLRVTGHALINPTHIPVAKVVELIEILGWKIRWNLLEQMNSALDDDQKMNEDTLELYAYILSLSGEHVTSIQSVIPKDHLSDTLKATLDAWSGVSLKDFPSTTSSLKSGQSNDILPSETYVSNIVMGHMSSLSQQSNFSIDVSLKHTMNTLVNFTIEGWYSSNADKSNEFLTSTLVALSLDATCEHIATSLNSALSRSFSPDSSPNLEANAQFLYPHVLSHIEKLLRFNSKFPGTLDEKILEDCGVFLERTLSSSVGKKAFQNFLLNLYEISGLFAPFAIQSDSTSVASYDLPKPINKFLIKLFQMAIKEMKESTVLLEICDLIRIEDWIENGLLQKWLISNCSYDPSSQSEDNPDGWLFLRALASYAVAIQAHGNGEFCNMLLTSLIPLGLSMVENGPEGMKNVPHLLDVMSSLASNTNGNSNIIFFKAMSDWVLKCKEKMDGEQDSIVLKTLCHLITFISDILSALKILHERSSDLHRSSGVSSPHLENEVGGDTDSDWVDELSPEDEESADDDSDDENLNNRLCTFTLTQKEFMNQHWYHCHTCGMLDGVGVCTVCAKVCHRGHDVTYAKYGSFFCDCGAKEDNSCQALVKRSTASYSEGRGGRSAVCSSAFGVDPLPSSSLRKKASSPTQDKNRDDTLKHRQALSKVIDSVRDQLQSEVLTSGICKTILVLLTELYPTIEELALQNSPIGSYKRMLSALNDVHVTPKISDQSDNLMLVTLGSQEGAFENVRLNYSGEQGQTIRQLINSHMIHRVAMCVLSSPSGKRQHLAVAHEKGKITVLQMSSLLRQSDSSKKKFTLTRLSSAPVPFTVLSVTANSVNDDFLAVCGVKRVQKLVGGASTVSHASATMGMKHCVISPLGFESTQQWLNRMLFVMDCHVLTFSNSGLVTDHLVLHPHLESGNYIIRALWIPGQQTQLALVCADFVKIYDLSVDSLSPQYFFQMPSGKIRDACFMVASDNTYHLIAMASSGYIYTQELCDQSSARHGPFFVTNVLTVSHPDLKDVNGEVGNGGVSIYYSHTLQLLCFSYANGKSFLAPLNTLGEDENSLDVLFPIMLKANSDSSSTSGAVSSANGSSNGNIRNNNEVVNGNVNGNSSAGSSTPSGSNNKAVSQPLCHWNEVPGHPGLITCVVQNSAWEGNTKGNSPVILMVKPDKIMVQEVRVVPSKNKMTDLVALRHSWSPVQEARTTLILLYEDGSLRIFNANPRVTDFWLSLQGKEDSVMSTLKPIRKKKPPKLNRTLGSVMFPVDFFEHCSAMSSIEFGGNDLLQIYNVQQLKNRLNAQNMYVASTKPGGFVLEVTNSDPNLVICGIRIQVGSVDVQRIPSYVEIFGRSVSLASSRSRWFDIPMTREESLQADKHLTLVFGPSTDPSGVTILDSIKIHGKTKDDFGWPDEAEEYPPAASSSATTSGGALTTASSDAASSSSSHSSKSGVIPLSITDRLVSAALETLDGCFSLPNSDRSLIWTEAIDLSTRLLNLPLPSSVQSNIKTILASLHSSKVAYHNHKDSSLLSSVTDGLIQIRDNFADPKMVDCESYHRLLVIARNVAVSRPHNLVKFTTANYKAPEQFEDRKNDSVDTITHDSCNLSPGETSPKMRVKTDKPGDSTSDSDKTIEGDNSECEPPFLSHLVSVFWSLHRARPCNGILTSVCQPGLTHAELTVHALVEIIHAFTVTSLNIVPYAVKLYSDLLLCDDVIVSFSAKQALIKVLRPRSRKRKVYIPSPPRCSTPGADDAEKDIASMECLFDIQPPFEVAEGAEMLPEAAGGDELEDEFRALSARVGINEAGAGELVRGDLGGALMDGIMDLSQNDDDAMVELAIALSMHDDRDPGEGQDLGSMPSGLEGLVGGLPGLQLQGLSGQVLQSLLAAGGLQGTVNQNNDQEVAEINISMDVSSAEYLGEGDAERDGAEESHDNEHFSDTTVSANGSDDEDGEGSNAATDGGSNLMMPSPAEQAGSGGSESGGSVGESLGGEPIASGRSSMYGDQGQDSVGLPLMRESTAEASASVMARETQESSEDQPEGVHLHSLRLALLDALIHKIQTLNCVGGVRSIPFLQVILMLSTDLDGSDARDKSTLESLLKAFVAKIDMNNWDFATAWERTPDKEVQLVILRFLGVLMSRSKVNSRSSSDSSLIPSITANTLMSFGILNHCLNLLKSLLEYWKNSSKEQTSGTVIGGSLLKKRHSASAPDMSPFFLRQYVKGNAHDVFAEFPQLLTDVVLRLPYQIKKLSEGRLLDSAWSDCLCEYTMVQQTPVVRRQVRKLLLFVCGHKENYRQLRDLHAIDFHMKDIKLLCAEGGFSFSTARAVSPITLTYDSLISLVEHLKACLEIASLRTSNWQKYCLRDETVLCFLMEVSYLLEEGVLPTVLQLVQSAICSKNSSGGLPKVGSSSSVPGKVSSSSKRGGTDEGEGDSKEENQCAALVSQINRYLDKVHLSVFIHNFLLESNSSNVRWQAHALILAIYKHSGTKDQEVLLSLMWNLWPSLPAYGSKAAQFVDLLGYFSLKTKHCENRVLEYIDKAVNVLKSQSQILANHPNASLYNSLSSLVEFDGYYLESEPCLVCNNPEIPFVCVKLSTVKVDSRFTTKTQLVKLVGSYMISRLTLRITDLKRSKMVRTLNVYYNNRSVQAIVELKNKPSMWNKAKKMTLSAGQSEVKMDFPLPIVACNIMIEYADFYENLQASTETLLCPRCSAAVPASPGVCANCGENVYQCHKCRAINYDEKDPFLCNACGYCKYAKFDYSLQCRPCCAVDPIENEEDRKKAVFNIDLLLEKADRSYKQLQSFKPNLELLLVRIREQGSDRAEEGGSNATHVNRAIQQLAQKYCGDCKNAFDELSKIIQRVQASRRELVAYDRAQKDGGRKAMLSSISTVYGTPFGSSDHGRGSVGRCYGCASSVTEHAITLLRALAINPTLRAGLRQQGLIEDLFEYNLRRGSVQMRCEVRQLLCLLTKDDFDATNQLIELITMRLMVALKSHVASSDLALAVRHEIALLAASAKQEDSCWEAWLRCVVQFLLMAGGSDSSPMMMEFITLPCIRILQGVMKPPTPPPPRKAREKAFSSVLAVSTAAVLNAAAISASKSGTNIMESYVGGSKVGVDMHLWIAGDPDHTYESWKKRASLCMKEAKTSKMNKKEIRDHYLMEKFGCIWLYRTIRRQYELNLTDKSWVKRVLFNPSSRMARHVTAQMLEFLCTSKQRKKEILNLMTSFLSEIGQSGENSAEFVSLFQSLISGVEWKHYLALKGVLPTIANLIMDEINHITLLEETTLNTDLSQGYSLKILTEILSSFVEVDAIKRIYKGRLLSTVLTGYLSLRKLVIQRTKLIDDTQKKLLELLEDMTTGTEEETKEFMCVCVDAVKQYPQDDLRTPVFIFERLCSIIYPEENDVGEFFLTLEKDPQQEDFLQGRMVGNPYSSLDPGMGPLMRDVKNKICQDCELVALLEDDSGMELLVGNKIISLDLPVKEVYKKVWMENSDNDAMRVIYRMRGLLGDATEEFVETLDKKKEENVDNEKVYRMADVMNNSCGLEVMLECLERVTDLSHAKPLVTVLMKLFLYCVKLKSNRKHLTSPSLGAIGILLHTLKQCLAAEPEMVAGTSGGPSLTEQVLMVLEAILVEAGSMSADRYPELVETCGTLEDIHLLLNYVGSSRTNPQVRQLLLRVLPFLVFCHKEKMELMVGHFRPVLDFEKYDASHSAEDQARMEAFCVFCNGIERNAIGNQLKDMILRANIVKDALQYIESHMPKIKKRVVVCDEEWKEVISKPSLKYILRLLAGLAWKHTGTQMAVAESCISAIHSLEQISSDERVGSLAENLLEALRDDPVIAKKVEEARRSTRQEKKMLAMKTRQKELQRLGLRANEKEQITSDSSFLQQMEDLTEESGLVCAICLEGYRCQPQKVLAIYTYSKRCDLNEHERKVHRTLGYCTVAHFNVVHVDCHLAAVRATRSRDEWDSAALHNANTKANGLLPLWGPQVPESAFASCLARHNTYLQESTTHRDIGYTSTLQDLKLLFMRYACERSFSDDSGGGGPQSNMNLIPYLLHMALYVMNTTRSNSREEKRVDTFIDAEREAWVESFFAAESPFFFSVLALAVLPRSRWIEKRLVFLQRLLATNHVRTVCGVVPSGNKVRNKTIQEWTCYKNAAVFWALIDAFFRKSFKNVTEEGSWSSSLAEFIRHNDQALLEASAKNLSYYQEDLSPCSSFLEFCDVADLLCEIENPAQYLSDLIQSLP